MKYIKTYESSIGPSRENKEEFTNYIMSYYGKNKMFGAIFKNKLTKSEVNKNINSFIKKRGSLFDGDSLDREFFRDYLLFKLGYFNLNELEYGNYVKTLLTDEEINVINYNL